MDSLRTLIGSAPRFLALRRSQYWSTARQEEQREHQLGATLRAAARIPFYRERFAGVAEPGDLACLPALRRTDLAPLFESLRTSHPDPARLVPIRSSGTTGAPVQLVFDARHQRGRFAARLRYLWENGWRPWHRMAWLIGLLPGNPDGDLSRQRLLPGARFVSHVDEPEVQADALQQADPLWIYTMPSNLEAVLRVLAARGARLRSLRGVFTGGEVLEDWLRERVQDQLGVAIADSYGTTEAFPAWQCPSGSYHVNVEHLHLEIVDADGHPVAPGTSGRVLLTTLENRLMPLVRYEIGDQATATGVPCRCGRTLPTIGRIEGRSVNLFPLADGRLLSPWRLLEPLREIPGVLRVQIVQHAVDRYTARYIAPAPAPEPLLDGLRAKLVAELSTPGGSPVRVDLARVDAIPRTARGKYLAAISELAAGPPDARR